MFNTILLKVMKQQKHMKKDISSSLYNNRDEQ